MKIIMMGDSTMKTNDATTYPQMGWGQMLPLFFNEEVEVVNFAQNGRSTKSFQELGEYDKAYACASKDDYCIIQFSHNDEKVGTDRYTDPATTYQDNLKKFVTEMQGKGVTPILVTPVARRHFENGKLVRNTHLEYPDAMKKVANNLNVTLIDISMFSENLLSSLGDENSKRLFMYFDANIYDNYLEGMTDNTHLRPDGAYLIAKLFTEELVKINHPLVEYLNKKE